MTFRKTLIYALISSFFIVTGCSKDDNGRSRQVRFEVSGNFTGNLISSFVSEGGAPDGETILVLPWVKNINYENTVQSTVISIGGNGGNAGQILTVKVYSGNELISSTPGATNGSGQISIVAPTLVF